MTAAELDQGVGPISFEDMFTLERVDQDRFRSVHTDGRSKRVFGGQLLGQSLAACLRTVEHGRPAHSLQVQFRQAGASDRPFEFAVERTSDGRSFSSRQVRVMQDDKLILLAMASFHEPERGLEFQHGMPSAPQPEALRSEQDLRAEFVLAAGGSEEKAHAIRHLAFEMRPALVQNAMQPEIKPPSQQFWARPYGAVPADPATRQAVVAYLSDILFLSTVLHPHGLHWLSTPMNWASLNHSVFFHDQTDFADWTLWHIDGVWTGAARGLARGSVYSRDGTLIASAVQEGLMRVKAAASGDQ